MKQVVRTQQTAKDTNQITIRQHTIEKPTYKLRKYKSISPYFPPEFCTNFHNLENTNLTLFFAEQLQQDNKSVVPVHHVFSVLIHRLSLWLKITKKKGLRLRFREGH